MPRRLRVEFRTDEAFRREYIENISNGGIFIASRETFDIREVVSVQLLLPAAAEPIELEGEVVHFIPPELAQTGASPGVAIQFLLDSEALRDRLGKLAPNASASKGEQGFGAGRRAAPRSRVRALVQVGVDGQWVDGRTRNISASGVLVRLTGEPLPIGRRVQVCLAHPVSQAEMELEGVVKRHIENAGETCLGIQFRIPEERRPGVETFLAQLRSTEHNRHLGGISGPIADLGMQRLLQMFGSTAPVGTLTLARREEEGVIAIDHGVIRVRLGAQTGRAALASLLAWTEGTFEFEARIEPGVAIGDAIPMADASPTSNAGAASGTSAASGKGAASGTSAASGKKGAAPDSFELELLEVVGSGAAELRDESLDAGTPDADGWPDAAAISGSKLAVDVAPIAVGATLALTDQSADEHADELSKTEQALLDLAGVGVKVGKAVEIIPEPAADVYAALTGLIAMGLITLR